MNMLVPVRVCVHRVSVSAREGVCGHLCARVRIANGKYVSVLIVGMCGS